MPAQEQESVDSVDLRIEERQRATSGRKPVPIREYVHTRKMKISRLKTLAEDKMLSVDERKKYRAQKFALQRRLEEKIRAYERRKRRHEQ